MPEKALITGGSGLLGTRLTELLLAKGWDVVHLGRRAEKTKVQTFQWDPSNGFIDAKAFEGVTKIIHLAGASIAGRRWTRSYKQEILNSRLQTTRLLYNELKKSKRHVSKVVSASAIGFYGAGPATREFTERDGPGSDFLSDVVTKWEAEVERLGSLDISVARVRTGIVLSGDGGALVEMARPIRFGFGAPLGSGEQVISWIHIDDLCRVYIYLLENDLVGPFNATAASISNAALTKAIAKVLNKPLWLPSVPAFVLKLILGDLAEAVLTGNNVSSRKIEASGFQFQYKDVELALADLL